MAAEILLPHVEPFFVLHPSILWVHCDEMLKVARKYRRQPCIYTICFHHYLMWHALLIEMFFVLYQIGVSHSRPHLQQGAPIFQMPMDRQFILRLIAAGTEYIRRRLDIRHPLLLKCSTIIDIIHMDSAKHLSQYRVRFLTVSGHCRARDERWCAVIDCH